MLANMGNLAKVAILAILAKFGQGCGGGVPSEYISKTNLLWLLTTCKGYLMNCLDCPE